MGTLAFAEAGWTTAQRKKGNRMSILRTPFMLNSRLDTLNCGHPDRLEYQTI
jgi:hypothetical protein